MKKCTWGKDPCPPCVRVICLQTEQSNPEHKENKSKKIIRTKTNRVITLIKSEQSNPEKSKRTELS